MSRTLYLHIGVHRTATTSIQDFLLRNFDTLLARGYLLAYRKSRHHALMRGIFSGKRPVEAVAQDLLKRMHNKAQPMHSVILTDEAICMQTDLSRLAEFRKHFDVKVIFSLRRQDAWLESWYFQNVKWQWNPKYCHLSFAEFMAHRADFHWIDYDAVLHRLETVFGAENIHLTVHESGQMPGGPVATFARHIGFDTLDGLEEPRHVNSSLSPMMSEFIRHLPFDTAPDAYRHKLVNACAAIDRDLQAGRPRQSERVMPHDQRLEVMAHYAAGNAAVAQRYFGRDTLFLDPLPAPDAPLAEARLPQDSETLLRDLVAPLLARMIQHHKTDAN